MIIKTDTLQIRILELIGLLGEAISAENKCFSKVICIPFSAVQTKIIPDGSTIKRTSLWCLLQTPQTVQTKL